MLFITFIDSGSHFVSQRVAAKATRSKSGSRPFQTILGMFCESPAANILTYVYAWARNTRGKVGRAQEMLGINTL